MTDHEFLALFGVLWSDINSAATFPEKRPLLAHYTSIATLECIAKSEEIWFSNPLLMNDLQELRFGMLEGAKAFRENTELRRACRTETRHEMLRKIFEQRFYDFDTNHAIDTYAFCASEHKADDRDGLLSMWRGYGANGNGVAIVFDLARINFVQDSPLIIAKVDYASNETRHAWIQGKLAELATLLETHEIPDDKLHLPALAFFERLKIFSLFSKHHGFSEEQEWRAVYSRERDPKRLMEGMLHYAVGRNGIEPKLRYKLAPLPGLTAEDLSLEKIVHQIILGPGLSTPLQIAAVRRMLEKLGKTAIAQRVIDSRTPFRPL